MNKILDKLKLSKQNPILIINAPEEYKKVIMDIKSEVHLKINGKYDFIQFFANTLADANTMVKAVTKAIKNDGLLWFCYPKGTSKKYHSDINRNKAWEIFGPYNYEAVSQISIDDDWSALRFRNTDKIKTLKRKIAASTKGKERIKNN